MKVFVSETGREKEMMGEGMRIDGSLSRFSPSLPFPSFPPLGLSEPRKKGRLGSVGRAGRKAVDGWLGEGERMTSWLTTQEER